MRSPTCSGEWHQREIVSCSTETKGRICMGSTRQVMVESQVMDKKKLAYVCFVFLLFAMVTTGPRPYTLSMFIYTGTRSCFAAASAHIATLLCGRHSPHVYEHTISPSDLLCFARVCPSRTARFLLKKLPLIVESSQVLDVYVWVFIFVAGHDLNVKCSLCLTFTVPCVCSQ